MSLRQKAKSPMSQANNPKLAYTNFEITVSGGSVRVQCSLVGEASIPFEPQFSANDQLVLHHWLETSLNSFRGLGGAPPPSRLQLSQPQEIGDKLFLTLFPPGSKTADLLSRSQAITRNQGGGLRLRLHLDATTERWPWELLHQPNGDYLVLTRNTTVVRYLDASQPIRSLRVEEPLRILLMAGWPGELDLVAEIASVQQALAPLVEQNLVSITVLEKAKLDTLLDLHFEKPFHVIHYLGHSEAPTADTPAELLLYDEYNQREAVPVDHLWRVLSQHDELRLIWLNSCSGAAGQHSTLTGPMTSAAARLVGAGLPAVLANQVRISDKVAHDLSRDFYTRLANGEPIDQALSRARIKISVRSLSSLEWATPVLFMRAPDGLLFERPGTQESAQPQATPQPQPATPAPLAQDNEEIAEEIAQLTEKLRTEKRILHGFEMQKASMGIMTPPYIHEEIRKYTKSIAETQAKIKQLQQS